MKQTMGLIKITEIESVKKEQLQLRRRRNGLIDQEKFEHRAFSDITSLIEYVNKELNE